MTRTIGLLLTLAAGVGGCANQPERPAIPVDQAKTIQVYDLALAELKRIMTPPAGSTPTVNWSERMYLNPVVLLPPADSANPLHHDSSWVSTVVTRGLVKGVCGKPPAKACPANQPVAFTSLSPVWTLGGDTVFVQGGYAGEAPGEAQYEALFWTFTLAPDDATGNLKVVRKSLPNRIAFESR